MNREAEVTLDFITTRYGLNLKQEKMPIEIAGKTRHSLSFLLGDLGFKTGVEIGVEKGLYSESICLHSPGIKLFSIDPWQAYEGYRERISQQEQDRFYEETLKRLSNYNCTVIRDFSLHASSHFEDNSLDFVYIDGNHDFVSCTNDISAWLRKVRVGGIIAGHDYKEFISNSGIHVKHVVDAYTAAYRIKPWFVFGAAPEDPTRDKNLARSWMWVKDVPVKSAGRN
jgi:predicted O-methyltransferase YrrM